MLDSSKSHQQLNFCYLTARHFIWICKRKETSPQVAGFLQYLKSMFDIEVKTAHSIPKKGDLLSTLFLKSIMYVAYSTARKYWCIFRDTAAVELQFVSPV